MAKYDVNYTCGHSETAQLYGPTKERYAEISRKETGVCPECWKKEQQEKARVQVESLSGRYNKETLPALTGSEKQIAWATEIRGKIASQANETAEKAESFRETKPENYTQAIDTLDAIMQRTSAKFWIDYRTMTLRDLMVAQFKGTI